MAHQKRGSGSFDKPLFLILVAGKGATTLSLYAKLWPETNLQMKARTRVNPHHATTQKSMTVGLTGEDIPLSVSGHEQQIGENGESRMKG
ncbi:hypothetical protein V6N12_027673 [Hibiscus sabdariffa]|uniref:Uncharacterized protein n=1 Tax=Hibiscus sabdariffa TaxID=183260 RepID=A0ABR2F3K1_9ROSI